MGEARLSEADRARIVEAVRRAETETAGEIYVVVAAAADPHRLVPILWAALVAILLPWPLYLLTGLSTLLILVLQAVAFALLSWILSHPGIRPRLVPGGIAGEAARRAAEAQFVAHGIHLTEARTGVLLYVALAERRVEVVADTGIDAKVGQEVWDELMAGIVSGARAGRLADGIVEAIGRAGTVLATHFPRRPDDRNELPDRVVEL
jgi:putative membrane protein